MEQSIPAALYARKSADESLSPSSDTGNQTREIREWAEKNGFEIVEEYIDEGVKGWTLERDGLKALREAIRDRHRKFKAVIISAWDRLSRDIGEAFLLLGEFDAYDTRIISVRQGEAIDENAKLGRDLYLLIAKRENAARGGHILAGQKRWASEGYSPGGEAPFGYRRKRVEDAKGVIRVRYEVDSEKAEIVRSIYHWYMEGLKIAEIARRLNESGVATPKTGAWNEQRVMRILFRRAHQEKYLGNMTFNRTRNHKKFKKATIKPVDEWIVTPNAHEAIITQEMVDAVNTRHQMQNKKATEVT